MPRDVYTESALSQIGLIDRQKKAVQYVKGKGSISRKEYAALNGVSFRQANSDLADLLKRRVLFRMG